ncbi:uncharacterized protein [Clytia hemisphaerica]|uniref:uncharacterized protein isoform X2 n=1 Tax=Clytia hemisphaerica TaxID=252671 RepID=UPI0034D517DA
MYKNFHLKHFGQWAPALFDGFILELMPPCGLHLILANHRYLWGFMYDVVNKRKMDQNIPAALKKIGCGYLAYQMEQYFNSKKKFYDGSKSLKMIGNDCRLLEENIDAFLNRQSGETLESPSARKLRQVLTLYKDFGELARDVRSTTGDVERIKSFTARAERYFKKFTSNASNSMLQRLPYLHLLRMHIGKIMVKHYELFGWCYGV